MCVCVSVGEWVDVDVTVSLCITCWSQSHLPLALASKVLGLQACIIDSVF
jgi:hypothetical protein